jgi:hypothetical protein
MYPQAAAGSKQQQQQAAAAATAPHKSTAALLGGPIVQHLLLLRPQAVMHTSMPPTRPSTQGACEAGPCRSQGCLPPLPLHLLPRWFHVCTVLS